jgi:hypothetical protein
MQTGPTTIRATGSFGFVTSNICGNACGEVQLGLQFELKNPVTPPDPAFLTWFPAFKDPLASE